MRVQVFKVQGMTCAHSVQAVTDELTRLTEVESVDVDLGTGAVTVAAERELDRAELTAAVEDAGYELVADRAEQGR